MTNAELAPSGCARVEALPSGRSVVVRTGAGAEELEVRSPTGDVEVLIRLTDDGPIVVLRGARLELDAVEAVRVRARSFEVEGETMRVKTTGDIHLNGDVIRLNC